MRHAGVILLLVLFASVVAGQQPQKVDEFEAYTCDDLIARIDNFVIHMKDIPNSKGLVFLYEGKYRELRTLANGETHRVPIRPRRGEIAGRKALIQRFFRLRRFDVKNVDFVEGGYRNFHTIEFWVIPFGAPKPKPTPDRRTMKFRAGKAPKLAYSGCPG